MADPLAGKERQSAASLEEWYDSMVRLHGEQEAEKMRSRLTARKSMRSYDNRKRVLPGAIFEHKGNIYVLRGQKNSGFYYLAEGHGDNMQEKVKKENP